MMNLLCIDPVINSGKVSAFTVFTEKGHFLHHRLKVLNPTAVPVQYLDTEKFSHICFDLFKALPTLRCEINFIWDVKILYELLGYKFRNIIELSTAVFGSGRVQKYSDLSNRVKAHLSSYREAKIHIGAYEGTKLLPESLLSDLYLERAKIVSDLFTALKDEDLEFYKKFYESIEILRGMSLRPLNIDLEAIADDNSHYAQSIRKNALDNHAILQFNVVGAKTGRIGFRKGTFNVYTLPKHLRACIRPAEGFKLVEFDFKAFQPRIAIFATDDEKFKQSFREVEDVYSMFPGERAKNKIGFLAWMYAKTRVSNDTFDSRAWPIWELRNKIYKKAKEEGFLVTKWGRRLRWRDEPIHIVFQNFITATEVDSILHVAKVIEKALEDRATRILFPFHDSLVCEVAHDEEFLVDDLKSIMESSLADYYPVGIAEGNNFSEMMKKGV